MHHNHFSSVATSSKSLNPNMKSAAALHGAMKFQELMKKYSPKRGTSGGATKLNESSFVENSLEEPVAQPKPIAVFKKAKQQEFTFI